MTNLRRLSLIVSLSAFELPLQTFTALRLVKPIIAIAIGFQFFSFSAFSQSITSAEAKANVGQEKTVTGTVMKISPVGKLTILDFDGVFPNAPFSAVIFGDKLAAFDKATLDSYKGKAVSVTGKIVLFKDKPQIALNEPGQITLAGAAPTPAVPPPASPSPQPATPSTPSPAPTTDNNQPTTTPPPTPAPAGNLLVNGNFNKGKKDWDLPADADVITESESQVLKITLKPGEAIVLKQEIKKFPKDGKPVQVSFEAKLGEGAKLTDGIKLTLGTSEKDGAHFSPKLTATTGSWQKLSWPSAKSKDNDNITLFIEISPGEGTLLLDNFHLSPN